MDTKNATADGVTAVRREVVLVTGFPRMIARRVVREVLARDAQRSVKLLVREKFLEDAAAFVRGEIHGARIAIVEGDCASIDMGLSGAEYRSLAEEVTHIQHHAHVSFEGVDEREAWALNVQGTREVIELAKNAPHLKRLVHHSTASVAGDRSGTVREEELEAGQSFRSYVAETRYRAERIVRRTMDALPVTVLRPAIIVGDAHTGEIDKLDGFYLLVMLMLTAPADLSLPMPTRGDATLNLVPIDYVAKAAAVLMNDPAAVSRTFHLVDPAPLTARKVYEVVARAAGKKMPRGFIPANVSRALLSAPGLDRFMRSPRAFLEQLATDVRYQSNGARDLLSTHDVQCPPFESYAEALVGYVRDRLAARKAQREPSASEIEDPLA